ncbi:hypothetical protein [Pseudomonas sp. PSKL.D1]|uniref:hypothetical protein n=1 Tax=Pseudomonas sp. PSKL.D1 TaxID=3029060 RepID=UPI002381735F|nr:hypothetical protein [Pseudomonas sp. PSKL.D1]WDY57223.1 hypothetical protein PVV54_22005 [Pseudomonas sp. PSKL.D1]
MKKLVPDPPPQYPVPYISIIADLSHKDAFQHATTLMDSLSNTIQLYLNTEAEDQRNVVLENLGILTELLRALFAHMAAREVGHG